MPDEAERRRQHDLTRQVLMRRYVRSDRARVKVRLPRPPDLILTRSLLTLAAGIVLLVIGHQLGHVTPLE